MPDLPPAIAGFFASEQSSDINALGACFTSDAVVRDQEDAYRGTDAITAWRLDTQAKTPFTSRPLELQELNGTFVVKAEVSGAFPNSPIVLDEVFTLVDGRIAVLDIT